MEKNNSRPSRLEFENPEISIENNEGRELQKGAILFSVKLIELLGAKMKEFNSLNPQNKVSLLDLKKVYINGANDFCGIRDKDKNRSEWALARVNMFLRQKLGIKMTSVASLKEVSNLVDISETWVPSDEDHAKASEEIKEYKLNYDFKDINELYIEPYERLEIQW